jgi:hypothetical protein
MVSAPYSIGQLVFVFQITPDTADDLPAYKRVYDSLKDLSTFGVIHNHRHQCLPPQFHTLCVFPLGRDSSFPSCLKTYVKRCKCIFNYYFFFRRVMVDWNEYIYLFLFDSNWDFFFIYTHFSALRKDRDADYLMAVAVVNNPLFDKFRNKTLVQPTGDVTAVKGSPTAGENVALKEKVPLRRRASRSADCSKTKGKKMKSTSRTSPEKELECRTVSGRTTRSSTRNQRLSGPSALSAATTHRSNEDVADPAVEKFANGKAKSNEESDQDVALPAAGTHAESVVPEVRPPRLTGPGVKKSLPIGVHQGNPSTVIHKTSGQTKEISDATIFPAGIQQCVSGEESSINRLILKTGGKLGKAIVDTLLRTSVVQVEDCLAVKATALELVSEDVVPEEGLQISGHSGAPSVPVGILKQSSSSLRVTSSTKAEKTSRAAKSTSAERQTGRQTIVDKSSHAAVKTLPKMSNEDGRVAGCARFLVATSPASRPTVKTLVPDTGLEPDSGSGKESTPAVGVVRKQSFGEALHQTRPGEKKRCTSRNKSSGKPEKPAETFPLQVSSAVTDDQQLVRQFLATLSSSGTTVRAVLQPSSSGLGDAFIQEGGAHQHNSYTLTHPSSSENMKIKLSRSTNTPLQTSVSASEGHSNRREDSITSTVLPQQFITQSPTGEGKLQEVAAEKRKQPTEDERQPKDSKLAKVDDGAKRRKRVSERSEAKSSPAEVVKLSTTDFSTKRSHVIRKLLKALKDGCRAGKVSTKGKACEQVAKEIEQSLYVLHNEHCGSEYSKKYRFLADRLKLLENSNFNRKLMEKTLTPGNGYIILTFYHHSLGLVTSFHVSFYIDVLGFFFIR